VTSAATDIKHTHAFHDARGREKSPSDRIHEPRLPSEPLELVLGVS
jgi:hypothetical protein